MDLVTLSTIKRMIGIEDEQTLDDDILTMLIAGVSAQIEKHLNRTVLSGTYTEYFDVETGAARFSVKAYPVTAVTSITNAADGVWADGGTVDSTSINFSSPNGVISIYGAALVEGADALRIIYTGGMAADTETLQGGDYADIALAATQQTIAVWNNRRYFGVQSAGGGAGRIGGSCTGERVQSRESRVQGRDGQDRHQGACRHEVIVSRLGARRDGEVQGVDPDAVSYAQRIV
jgi:hypothetical protein